jgi:hypothetical protein
LWSPIWNPEKKHESVSTDHTIVLNHSHCFLASLNFASEGNRFEQRRNSAVDPVLLDGSIEIIQAFCQAI